MKGDITKLDANFKQQEAVIDGNDKIFTLPCKEIDLYGATYDYERGWFQRMPCEIAKQITYNVEVLSSTTAGVRARFKTNSKKLGISVAYKYLAKMSNMPLSGCSGFTLLEETDEGCQFAGQFKPTYDKESGFTAQVSLKGGVDGNPDSPRCYILFFPLYNDYITDVKLIFDADCKVENGVKYKHDLPILYYGSSITQGGCCSRSDNCYQAYISKWHNVDYINLGFSGGAKGEDIMIDYLASVKSKVFVCDYDHNAPTLEHLKNTHYKVYAEYRKKNPDTPIVFMSKPDFDRDKKDNLKRLKVIKATYLKAQADGDKNVYFVDGRKLFGSRDRENCTADGCHPNDLGFYRMALELDKTLKNLL